MDKFLFSLIFYYLINQSISSNYIVFPLKVLDEFDKLENLLSFNSTYTTIEMGEPEQKVNFYFNLEHSKMYITNIGCKDINLYNFSISSTMNVFGDPTDESIKNRVLLLESLYLYNDTNLNQTIEISESINF